MRNNFEGPKPGEIKIRQNRNKNKKKRDACDSFDPQKLSKEMGSTQFPKNRGIETEIDKGKKETTTREERHDVVKDSVIVAGKHDSDDSGNLVNDIVSDPDTKIAMEAWLKNQKEKGKDTVATETIKKALEQSDQETHELNKGEQIVTEKTGEETKVPDEQVKINKDMLSWYIGKIIISKSGEESAVIENIEYNKEEDHVIITIRGKEKMDYKRADFERLVEEGRIKEHEEEIIKPSGSVKEELTKAQRDAEALKETADKKIKKMEEKQVEEVAEGKTYKLDDDEFKDIALLLGQEDKEKWTTALLRLNKIAEDEPLRFFWTDFLVQKDEDSKSAKIIFVENEKRVATIDVNFNFEDKGISVNIEKLEEAEPEEDSAVEIKSQEKIAAMSIEDLDEEIKKVKEYLDSSEFDYARKHQKAENEGLIIVESAMSEESEEWCEQNRKSFEDYNNYLKVLEIKRRSGRNRKQWRRKRKKNRRFLWEKALRN